MNLLNKTSDCEYYLTTGILTAPFLPAEYVKEKVVIDYNRKKIFNINATILESLFNWINHNVKFCKNKDYNSANKFKRSAKEIWESKLATGCTDFAILFATLARQLNIPTTILYTAEESWLESLRSGKNCSRHKGHVFCECYYNKEWILVDPSSKKIINNYNIEKINLNYKINNSSTYIPYLRNIDFGKKQSIFEHNKEMDLLCLNR